MIYNETYIGRACRVEELIALLSGLPKLAFLETHAPEHSSDTEVWYDKDTNTVLLK